MTGPSETPRAVTIEAHRTAREAVDALSPSILEVLHSLHGDPELSGQEYRAARRLIEALSDEGFEVDEGICGLPTAFVARKRVTAPRTGPGAEGKPTGGDAAPATVGFLAEYDALPGLGHGCAHNLIAAAALGAGIAAGRVAGLTGGEVRVYGTPAEETVGGKVILAGRGAFDGLDAAMMVHAGSEHRVHTDSLACRSVQVTFHGRAAHAVAHPEKGINALDALIQLFIASDQIRRASRRDVRLPGVITEGGVRANVIPDRSVGQFSLRAGTAAQLADVLGRFRRAVESIAAASGCGFDFRYLDNAYDEMVTNRALAEVYKAHLVEEGIETTDDPREHKGSLDMGNVSYRVPSIHPYVPIAPPAVASHTAEFARASVSAEGEAAALLSARMMALTAADLLSDSALVARVREEFRAMRARAEVERGPGFDAPGEYVMERPA